MLDTPERRDPEQTFRDPDEKAMACAITITTQVGTNRNVVVQTYLDRDAPISQYHEVFDKLNRVVDRQEASLQLVDMEANLLRSEKNLKNMVEDFNRIETKAQEAWENRGKKGAFKLSEAELTHKSQAKVVIERTYEEINRLKADIAKARGVVSDVE